MTLDTTYSAAAVDLLLIPGARFRARFAQLTKVFGREEALQIILDVAEFHDEQRRSTIAGLKRKKGRPPKCNGRVNDLMMLDFCNLLFERGKSISDAARWLHKRGYGGSVGSVRTKLHQLMKARATKAGSAIEAPDL